MVKIVQKFEECIGCGACTALDPVNWEMKDDKAILKDAELKEGIYSKVVESVGASKEAENACPVKCIIIEE